LREEAHIKERPNPPSWKGTKNGEKDEIGGVSSLRKKTETVVHAKR